MGPTGSVHGDAGSRRLEASRGVGGGVVTKTFVATGLTIVRDSLSTVCAPDVAFGGDGVVGVIGGDSRRLAEGSSAVGTHEASSSSNGLKASPVLKVCNRVTMSLAAVSASLVS